MGCMGGQPADRAQDLRCVCATWPAYAVRGSLWVHAYEPCCFPWLISVAPPPGGSVAFDLQTDLQSVTEPCPRCSGITHYTWVTFFCFCCCCWFQRQVRRRCGEEGAESTGPVSRGKTVKSARRTSVHARTHTHSLRLKTWTSVHACMHTQSLRLAG